MSPSRNPKINGKSWPGSVACLYRPYHSAHEGARAGRPEAEEEGEDMRIEVHGAPIFFDTVGPALAPVGGGIVFEGAGHGVHRDEPERAESVLRAFLATETSR